MAGGSGKYNAPLIAAMARGAAARAGAQPAAAAGTGSLRRNAGADAAAARGAAHDREGLAPPGSMPPGRRHAWVLGPAEDPGPHAALLVSGWVRQGSTWHVRVIWYSEEADAVVQQSVPASALRPAGGE